MAKELLDDKLYNAAYDGNVAAIERLVAEGASPDAKDEHGYPAVVVAAEKDHTGVVSALVKHGADLDAMDPDRGHTALMIAADNGNVECARALLAGGANRALEALPVPAYQVPAMTALEIAESAGRSEVAALLSDPPAQTGAGGGSFAAGQSVEYWFRLLGEWVGATVKEVNPNGTLLLDNNDTINPDLLRRSHWLRRPQEDPGASVIEEPDIAGGGRRRRRKRRPKKSKRSRRTKKSKKSKRSRRSKRLKKKRR